MSGPRDAEITIVGGGAVGAAAAYFLARDGHADVQLLEARGLCEATSSQAAGMVGQARPTVDRARLTMKAAAIYRDFERETGYSMDYRECGAVRLALSEASVRELRQIAETAGITGLPVEFLTDAQLRELYPVLTRTESVKAALWSPTDGYLQPNSLVTAYVSAARDLGVTVATNAAVTGIGVRRGVVESVSTEAGTYRTEQVIIAAGPWSAALARLAGLELPIVPVLHEYFVTEPVPGWHAGLPCLRIPEVQVYARGESDRVLCGGFENSGTSIDPRDVTVMSRLAARPDWDVLGGFAGQPEYLRAGGGQRGHRHHVPGLARLHPGRAVHRRPGQRDPGPGPGRGLQRPRRLRFGRAGHAPGGEPDRRSLAVRAVAEPGPVHPAHLELGRRPPRGPGRVRELLSDAGRVLCGVTVRPWPAMAPEARNLGACLQTSCSGSAARTG